MNKFERYNMRPDFVDFVDFVDFANVPLVFCALSALCGFTDGDEIDN